MKKKNLGEIIGNRWSGGITKELYRDMEDFNIRISSASIEPGSSKFSDFSRYRRILIILENEVTLTREDELIDLREGDAFSFHGKDEIRSENEKKVLDFNLIWDPLNVDVNLNKIYGESNLLTSQKIFIFSVDKGSNLNFNNKDYTLDKYDFIEIPDSEYKDIKFKGKFILINWK
ncbi:MULTISPECIES: HutD family protein [Psychrilyobacter]|nr:MULTISPECIES: HutD family protein [Psychrilyobacter]MCS5421596.1 HutD family protein [Psychrilyobacter sp. S5]NDI78168.1 HutD family protein [Psychrilyobacter piezotolerans]